MRSGVCGARHNGGGCGGGCGEGWEKLVMRRGET